MDAPPLSLILLLLLAALACAAAGASIPAVGSGSTATRWLKAASTSQAKLIDLVRREQVGNPPQGANTPIPITWLPSEYKSAACLDGTPYAFYYRPAKKKTDLWVFFLQGGGLCVEPIDCAQRKKTRLGSSKYFTSTWNGTTDAAADMLSSDPELNPAFHDAHHVFLPYCSGDTWTGTRAKAGNLGFRFSGHLIVQSVVEYLNTTTDLPKASRVLLTGGSAGGIGTFNNADAARETWFPHVDVFKAAPISGFYFPGPVEFYPETALGIHSLPINDFASFYLTSWFGSKLDSSCVAAMPVDKAHRCWDASTLYKHIETSLFVVENHYDANQIESVLVCPVGLNTSSTRSFVNSFGTLMRGALGANIVNGVGRSKGDGLFAPSCLRHTSDICIQGGPTVQGHRLRDLLPVWFNTPASSGSASDKFRLTDDCDHVNGPCNPLCQC